MRNTLATLALAAVAALMLSACNGGSGSSAIAPVPNAPATSEHGRAHRNDTGPASLHAGGADFPAFAYNDETQPVGSYNQYQAPPPAGTVFYAAPTTGTIYYCINNSGDGRKAFEDNGDSGFPPTGPCAALNATPTGFGGRQDPLDFVGTAVALPSTECCGAGSPYYTHRDEGTETWGQPFEIPQIGGLISLPYVASEYNVSPIKLSTWSLCAIANGTIGNWDDPALTKDNGGTALVSASEPITFYYRSDSSGTTYNFIYWLNTECNQTFGAPYNGSPYSSPSRSAAWTGAVGSSWTGPTGNQASGSDFIGVSGAPAIAADVQSTAYATGYLEGSYAKAAAKPALAQAWVQDGPYSPHKGAPPFGNPTNHNDLVHAFANVTASDIDYGVGSDGNSLNSSTPWCQLYIPNSAFVTPTTANSYPIVGISYLLFYGQNNGLHTADKKTLITFVEGSAAAKIEKGYEYTALNSSIETAVLNALAGNSSQAACLQ